MYISIYLIGRDQQTTFSETCVFQKKVEKRRVVHERVNICKIEHVYKYISW